ncbi:hypothetical protein [Streptomyces canus]|uniref:hypothetical protein n=1 Tax=Streptomyces canus TaxID=58343 RepID=UPI00386BD798|nr:hypothetical protein OH824_34795 [Streptomyces canus]
MPTSPGPILQALIDLWERLRAEVPDLPPIQPAIPPATRTSNHGPERWGMDADGTVTGLVVDAETLSRGPEAVLETVLHEAAHILNWRRDVNDVTSRGAYHTQAFLVTAEEVGLEREEGASRSATRGFESVALTDVARRRHTEDLKTLAEIVPPALAHMPVPTPPRDRHVSRLTLRCSCDPPRTFRISRTWAAAGPITCGVCGEPFTEE